MPSLHVCSLARLEATIHSVGAEKVLTVINAGTAIPALPLPPDAHLFLGMNDITAPVEGLTPPARGQIEAALGFAATWSRRAPMVVHCWAGVSRSTATAFAIACLLRPRDDEGELAAIIRARSPTATPNARIVALADEILGRGGRMVRAAAAIGRGAECMEGVPFALEIDTAPARASQAPR